MYSHEQRMAAVRLYILYENPNKVIKELGYPSSPVTVLYWFKEFKENGCLHKRYAGPEYYSEEEKRIAIEHYKNNGRNIQQTIEALGYPSAKALGMWLNEDDPERGEKLRCHRNNRLLRYSQEKMEQAAIDICSGLKTNVEIAREFGISTNTFYKLRKLLHQEEHPAMKVEKPSTEREVKRLTKRIQALEARKADMEAELLQLRMEYEILEKAAAVIKKGQGINLETLSNREKAEVIGALRDKYRLNELLKALNMPKSSYCYHANRMKMPDKHAETRVQIQIIFTDSDERYGYRRINTELRNKGIIISEKIVRRLMTEDKLVARRPKKRKYTSYMGEISPAVPNLLKRDFHADAPNKKWITDITEFSLPEGKVYLSPIIDCFDGLPVSWTIGTSPNAELANTMLDTAISSLKPGEHPIIHSDRGCHYRWPGWIERTKTAGLVRSMSKKGCSPDNSACEGFFGRLKVEMFYGREWADVSIPDFINKLDEYMHWYGEKRIKMSLGGMSPLSYRKSLGLVA